MPPKSSIPRTCEVCGATFEATKSVVAAGYGRYCSRSCMAIGFSVPIEERFWDKVDRSRGPNSCWEWTANRHRQGYGKIKMNGITYAAHRIAWELTNGPIPDGLLALHSCDNPPCCNPIHLFLGTYADNSDDMWQKGRNAILKPPPAGLGELNHSAKLTWEQVREIRARYVPYRMTARKLAVEYGVSRTTVNRILIGVTWRE